MKKPEFYIWDLDGTLIDSYDVIVRSILDTVNEIGIRDDYTAVMRMIKQSSSGAYFKKISADTGIPSEELFNRYRYFSHHRDYEIQLIPGAAETLELLSRQGAKHLVYTHRGASSFGILKRLGIDHLFEDVVTKEDGFPLKPAPDGILYLLEKHRLEKNRCVYVGDRNLDIECARNAGIRSILYLEADSCVIPDGTEDRIVTELKQILNLSS